MIQPRCLPLLTLKCLLNRSENLSPNKDLYGIFPGKITGVGCHFLLQWIFPSQGLNPGSPALQGDSLLTESLGKYININNSFFGDNEKLEKINSHQ